MPTSAWNYSINDEFKLHLSWLSPNQFGWSVSYSAPDDLGGDTWTDRGYADTLTQAWTELACAASIRCWRMTVKHSRSFHELASLGLPELEIETVKPRELTALELAFRAALELAFRGSFEPTVGRDRVLWDMLSGKNPIPQASLYVPAQEGK